MVIYPRLLTACALSGMKKGLEALHASIESGTTVEREDLGPRFGAYLADGSEYRGDYTASWDEIRVFHRERLEVLVASGPSAAS